MSFLKSLALGLAFLLTSLGTYAQSGKPRVSPPDSAMGRIGNANVKIKYGSPSVKGRAIWGELVPYSKVWRAGANEATQISFDQPVTVEGKQLAAGTYALFFIPEKGAWTVIFNKTAKQWGAYDYKQADDALRVTATPKALSENVERLQYIVQPSGIVLRWEKLELPVAIK